MFGRYARLAVSGGLGLLSLVVQPLVAHAAAADVETMARWVGEHHDNRGQPFAIVDKRDARLYVFGADGTAAGDSPVLLGLQPGDDAVADIAQRAPASLRPFERTTPAGRFASQPGHNLAGDDIVWIDYAASLAIHRLRPAPAGQHRADRIVSARPEDKRISFGCVVVPVAFYDQLVAPVLGHQHGVVYVLPEMRPLQALLATAR